MGDRMLLWCPYCERSSKMFNARVLKWSDTCMKYIWFDENSNSPWSIRLPSLSCLWVKYPLNLSLSLGLSFVSLMYITSMSCTVKKCNSWLVLVFKSLAFQVHKFVSVITGYDISFHWTAEPQRTSFAFVSFHPAASAEVKSLVT